MKNKNTKEKIVYVVQFLLALWFYISFVKIGIILLLQDDRVYRVVVQLLFAGVYLSLYWLIKPRPNTPFFKQINWLLDKAGSKQTKINKSLKS